jgi:hypothetical protein
MLPLLLSSSTAFHLPIARSLPCGGLQALRMQAADSSGKPGTPANLDDYKEYQFAKKQTTDDGSCFIVDDSDAPDAARSWFYCDDPNMEDEDMVCELVPEWMGTSPSGDHAVWLCSKPKPS